MVFLQYCLTYCELLQIRILIPPIANCRTVITVLGIKVDAQKY